MPTKTDQREDAKSGVNNPIVIGAVEQLGPRIFEDLGAYPLCVVSVGSGGSSYGLALCDYLRGQGADVKYADLRRPSSRLYKHEVRGRIVLFVDDNVGTGRTYRYLMKHRVPILERESEIAGARFVAPIDIRDLADYRCDVTLGTPDAQYASRAMRRLRDDNQNDIVSEIVREATNVADSQ